MLTDYATKTTPVLYFILKKYQGYIRLAYILYINLTLGVFRLHECNKVEEVVRVVRRTFSASNRKK
jgi:hypothetical protein